MKRVNLAEAKAQLSKLIAAALAVKAYDQARRAIQYVRWEQGDPDSIAPSLYSGRGNSNVKRRAEDAEVTPSPIVQVAAPLAVNGSVARSPQAPVPGLPSGIPFSAS